MSYYAVERDNLELLPIVGKDDPNELKVRGKRGQQYIQIISETEIETWINTGSADGTTWI